VQKEVLITICSTSTARPAVLLQHFYFETSRYQRSANHAATNDTSTM